MTLTPLPAAASAGNAFPIVVAHQHVPTAMLHEDSSARLRSRRHTSAEL